ncbi:MAG: peptidase, partial [Dactylosporangium sp.]|nr:peptidase [Dactylosporangium sp.]
QIADAAAAGAAVALLVRPADWSAWTVWHPDGDRLPVPALAVANDDGQKLLDRVQKGRSSIDLTLTTSSPYLYDVFHVETGRIPERIVHRVTETNSMRIKTRYAYNGGFDWVREQRFGWRPWQTYSWLDESRIVATPSEREEWVSAGDSMWQHRVNHAYPWNEFGPLMAGMVDRPQSYRPGHTAETWFGPVVRPAAPKGVPSLVSTRAGDTLRLRVPEFVDSAGGHYTIGEADQVNAKVWRDGTLLTDLPDARQDVTTTPGDAAYRVALTTARGGDDWQWGTRTETVWQFRSGNRPGPAPLPLLQVDYRVPTDLSGRVSGEPGEPHVINLGLRHQDGLAAPQGTTLKVEVSFDEGGHWKPVWSAGRDMAYTARIPAGNGTVSLKVHATDRSGNAVTQTIIRAYGTAGGSHS